MTEYTDSLSSDVDDIDETIDVYQNRYREKLIALLHKDAESWTRPGWPCAIAFGYHSTEVRTQARTSVRLEVESKRAHVLSPPSCSLVVEQRSALCLLALRATRKPDRQLRW